MNEQPPIDRPRILLVSDKLGRSGRRCAQIALAGLQAVKTVDPVEALSVVRSEDIDLVLLQMPLADMIDMDLPNVMRRVAGSAYLPLMVLAEDPAETIRCGFLESGADDIVSRRTSGAEMIARMRALLRVKRLHDELSASRAALRAALQRERELLAKLQRDNANLKRLVRTDPLTRAQNVRSCHDILQHEFNIAKRYNQRLSLLMVDVDHFKVVNDTHGHRSGDYVLKELAVVLKQSVRDSDVVARTGGDEFTLILPKTDRKRAAASAQRIRKHVGHRKFNVYGHDIHITISIGSASYPQDVEVTEPGMLWYFADQALLAAKEAGRDRVVAVHAIGPAVRHRLRSQYLQMQSAALPIRREQAAGAQSPSR